MWIITRHPWAGFRVERGLWIARTFGFVTIERIPAANPAQARVVQFLHAMRRMK